jgi:FMN phosphatase YigB (HAD superfamily)
MKCTQCNTKIRPVVSLDVDGTLGDYHDFFGRFALRYWNRKLRGAPWRGDGEFEDYLGLTKAEYREAKMAYRQGGMKRIQPVYLNAIRIAQAASVGAEVWITTTRPWKRLDNIDPDTQWWLQQNGIYYDHLLYDADKYHVLAERVTPERVAFVLEDLPEQFVVANDLFGAAAHLIERYHNSHWRQGIASPQWCRTMGVAVYRMQRAVSDWYENMGETR